jgi:hypothetical protein
MMYNSGPAIHAVHVFPKLPRKAARGGNADEPALPD